MENNNALFLGLDASTQSLSAMAIDSELRVAYEASVNFDEDLPEFETEGGATHHPDGLTVTAPAIMWVAALDLLLDRMKSDGFDFSRVACVSGSGQQHGSVYLNDNAAPALAGLSAGSSLREQLTDIFSVADSPIWMDSSTRTECNEREAALGGPQGVADLTGARSYERFTGNQIAKIRKTNPAGYEASARISLVSSFMASLLVGSHAPIDWSDGTGMNLLDIRAKTWADGALDVTAPGLAAKLGKPVPSHSDVGAIHQYFVDTCGFSPACRVVAFSGDNPNSLAGLRLQHSGDIAISLGTSDTMFSSVSDPTPSITDGVVFANPIDPNGYMVLVCYKNGSLTRENIRDKCTAGSWDEYRRIMKLTQPGNGGNIGFYFLEPEITPPMLTAGAFRFDADNNPVESFAPEVEARAVIETQFLSMRLRCTNMGIVPASILATGGASGDESVLRVMSDVFGLPILTAEQSNSAALGAAYRALHAWRCIEVGSFTPFDAVMENAPAFTKVADPDMEAHALYTSMLSRFTELEKRVQGGDA